MFRLVTVALALLLVTACGEEDPADVTISTTTTTTAPTTTTTADEESACSAAGLSAEPTEQPDLPAAVAEKRRAIVEAAVACDFDELEALALEGDGTFTYSFGDGGEPAAHWQREEESDRGPDPLRFLVALLDRPHRLIEAHDAPAQYVWPSAFAYDSWDEVPDAEKEALKPLYTEDDFESFDRFGGYIGYRIGITTEGDWIFFVAGD